jgi:hypothetical protein
MVGISSLVRDFDRGKPLLYPMEPRERLNTYDYRINRGKPFPKSLECDASPTLYVLLWESADDVSTSTKSIHWSQPWLLLEPWLAT